jgi:hypothetical protein
MKMDDQPFLSLKAAVELPTGDPKQAWEREPRPGFAGPGGKKLTRYLQATGNGVGHSR